MSTKFPQASGFMSGEEEDLGPNESYECTLDVHTLPLCLPNGRHKEIAIDLEPDCKVDWMKKQIMDKYYTVDEKGNTVNQNDYELVLVTRNMDSDADKCTVMGDDDMYGSFEHELMYASEMHVVPRGAMPQKKPSSQLSSLGVIVRQGP